MAESSNLKKTNLSQQDSSNPAFDSLLKKAKKYLDKDEQISLRWDDPTININWPKKTSFILSKRDT